MTAPVQEEGLVRIKLSELSSPFTGRQTELWESCQTHPFTLYGGARGGGKSFALRWIAIRLLLKWYATQGLRNVRVGIFCEDGPTLNERQVTKAYVEYPAWLGRWVMSPWPEFRLHEKYGGGVVAFRNLDDPERYRSAEFAAVLVDELTRNSIETFNILRGSRRWPGIENPPFVGATNPTGKGHTWCRDIWVDSTFQMDETQGLLEVYGRESFKYVKATAYDNPHNAASYLRELESLPPRLRAAFLDGNWDVFEGQAFDEWNADYHVVPNWRPPETQWRYAMGMDWGWRHGWMGLFASGPDGDVECVWEWYFGHVYAYQAAKDMAARLSQYPKPEYIACDSIMWQENGIEGGKTLAEEFVRGLRDAYGSIENAPRLVQTVQGKGSRKVKFDLTHQYLAWKPTFTKEGILAPWARPKLRFHQKCTHAIRTIKALPVDPDKPEDDVDTTSEDHPYDGVTAYLMSRPALGERLPKDLGTQQHPGFQGRKRRPRYERLMQEQGQLGEGDLPQYEVPRKLEILDE